MAQKVTVTEASRRAGVDRSTIHRKVKNGTISVEVGPDGRKRIDLSELQRVYPGAATGDAPPATESAPRDIHMKQQGLILSENNALQRETDGGR